MLMQVLLNNLYKSEIPQAKKLTRQNKPSNDPRDQLKAQFGGLKLDAKRLKKLQEINQMMAKPKLEKKSPPRPKQPSIDRDKKVRETSKKILDLIEVSLS